MTHVNMPEAETTLSELVEKAQRGEDVVIWRNGIPVPKLVTVTKLPRKDLRGIAKGLFTMTLDFDRPMTQKEFEEFLP
jgi:antitoxin (DNA-binding transcriptional repressor) of toxin-antitoxin stability system